MPQAEASSRGGVSGSQTSSGRACLYKQLSAGTHRREAENSALRYAGSHNSRGRANTCKRRPAGTHRRRIGCNLQRLHRTYGNAHAKAGHDADDILYYMRETNLTQSYLCRSASRHQG